MAKTVRIDIRGLVQGVGFRPHIFRLATQFGITGWVKNTNEGVEIIAQGEDEKIKEFADGIIKNAPVASEIESLKISATRASGMKEFSIIGSETRSSAITNISPDIAVCSECMEDLHKQPNRLAYPFVNCTNCGPRFSIITDIPYDRVSTSMKPFEMCEHCRAEYEDIRDRRFHAQPTACRNCGPEYRMIEDDKCFQGDIERILNRVSHLLLQGKIIAMKGVGGFHLVCDACNEQAIKNLRERKRREGKPFAIMFRDIRSLERYAYLDETEKAALMSWRRPIVILDRLTSSRQGINYRMSDPPGNETSGPGLPEILFSGLGTIGAFLPYMPIHHLIFSSFEGPALVMTSGNMASEPIVKDNNDALIRFASVADAFLDYNREIVNRSDDSIIRVIHAKERIFRRSRGYVPTPLNLNLNAEGIVGFGAELSSCFCIGKSDKAILSQHIGDLKTMETGIFFKETMNDFLRLFRVRPELLACDLHPAYLSSGLAQQFPSIPLIRVQHHHAHIAACMAEKGLDEKIIGVAFDGTGFGTDGKIWGAEFLIADLADFNRQFHFEYIPLPGGDKAIDEPWRIGLAYLYKVFGSDFIQMPLPFLSDVGETNIHTVIRMIDHRLNCPMASSAGRLFDAVAALMNLCHRSTFQAEAPMRLESIVIAGCSESYPYRIGKTIRIGKIIEGVVADLIKGVEFSFIATKFHNTLISIIFDAVSLLRHSTGIEKVVLSGGVFQNRYLLENTEKKLAGAGFKVFSHEKVPSGDGSIALGQLVIAAKRRTLKML